jgi:nucleoside-diphosphate-sugar epimerase
MRVLVTGGFGFLGSHLVEALLKTPHTFVHVVDNLSTNPLPLDRLLFELGSPGNLTYSIADVADYCQSPLVERFDEIYHLASIVGPAGVLPHAGRIAASIVNDTMAVTNLAIASGAKVVDVSTSEVYGGGQEGFCSETMPKIVPATPSVRLEYAVGKLAAETSVLNLCKGGTLDARIVRPFNITGPRQSGKGGFVLPRFVGQAMADENITIFGDGRQIRAFTHVTDMADGILCAMHRGQRGEIYNLGNPANRCSILELAEAVRAAVIGTSSAMVFVDPKTVYGPLYEEADNKFPDAGKALSQLGWRPRFDRHAVIQDTVDYMRSLPLTLLEELQGFERTSLVSGKVFYARQ